jgi:hypothetical protein
VDGASPSFITATGISFAGTAIDWFSTTQSEGDFDRALRSDNKSRQRLGTDPGMAPQFPERPKGMWRRTYCRLHEQTFETETRAEEALAIHLERFADRIEKSNHKRDFWA